MGNLESLEYLRDFRRRLMRMNEEDEKFVRELMVDIVADCPIPILEALAWKTYYLRSRELSQEANAN